MMTITIAITITKSLKSLRGLTNLFLSLVITVEMRTKTKIRN